MYKREVVYLTYFCFIFIFWSCIIFILKTNKLKKFLLMFFPLFLIIDIPINQFSQANKPFCPIRLWYLPMFMLVFLYFKQFITFIVKNLKYLLLLFMFFLLHFILSNFNLVIFRSYIKIIFMYFPLIFIAYLFTSSFNLKEQKKYIILTLIPIVFIDILQIVSFNFLGKNLFIFGSAHRPSSTFTEPVWNGVFLVFLYLLNYNVYLNILILLLILLSRVKIAYVFLLLSIVLKGIRSFFIFLTIIPIIIYLGFKLGFFSWKNLIDSILVHSGNIFLSGYAFLTSNVLQKILGQGFGLANYRLSFMDNFSRLSFFKGQEKFLGVIANRMGGNCGNIFLEVLNGFGIVGLCYFIYKIIILFRKAKTVDKISKEKFTMMFSFFLLTSQIHPLYFMGFGIFILFFIIFNIKNLRDMK